MTNKTDIREMCCSSASGMPIHCNCNSNKWGKDSKWKTFLSFFTRWKYPSKFADPNWWQPVKENKQRGRRSNDRGKSNG